MKQFIEWLLNLDRVSLQDTSKLRLEWLDPVDSWLWFVILIMVAMYVALIYRRESGPAVARVLMAGFRGLTILFVFVLLCQPMLVYQRDRTEPSTIAVLLDGSLSMTFDDYYPPDQHALLQTLISNPGDQQVHSRWQLTSAAFNRKDGHLLRGLLQNHDLRLFRFAGSTSHEWFLKEDQDVAAVLEEINRIRPNGTLTDIAGSISEVFDACIDAHLTAIVLVTDGQPTLQADWEAVTRISTARGTPIWVMPVGLSTPPKDLAIESIAADRHIYQGDHAAIKATIRSRGLPANTPFEVILRHADSGQIIDRQVRQAPPDGQSQELELQFKPSTIGDYAVTLELPAVAGELNLRNNQRTAKITVVEDKIRVLYVEGYPRYEYRYLKNVLLLEPSVVSSFLLLSADVAFVQDGDEPVRRFPNSVEELANYDVILFGDVDPRGEWLTGTQMESLVEFVNKHGGGFGVIAGEAYSPNHFYGTPLSKLVPIELGGDPHETLALSGNAAYQPRLTAAGREHPIFRLLIDEQRNTEIFERLPPWYWFADVRGPSPGAETLLAHPQWTHNDKSLPLVVSSRYGAGTVFYQGSDDSWRWRRYKGESFFNTYWLQVIRFLGRHKKFPQTQDIVLRTHAAQVDAQDTVIVSLEFQDRATAALLPASLRCATYDALGIDLGDVMLSPVDQEAKRYEGEYIPSNTGLIELTFSPREYGLDRDDLSVRLEVAQHSLENRQPEANTALMSQLAERTGGAVVEPWHAERLLDDIPARVYSVPDDVSETIWDCKLAVCIFGCLIVGEWVLRKLYALA